MNINFMLVGAFLLFGWLWAYVFLRQFIFNLRVAYPLINQMLETDSELIAKTSKQYTAVSTGLCAVVSIIILFVICRFCPVYMTVSFFIGAAIGLFMIYPTMVPTKREAFDSFCSGYYRFVPDDELRTAMYNKKPSQMKMRLHVMGLSIAFVPKFEDSGKK